MREILVVAALAQCIPARDAVCERHGAVRADRLAAGNGRLFNQQGFGAGLRRIQRRDATGKSEADDDDVERFVEYTRRMWHARQAGAENSGAGLFAGSKTMMPPTLAGGTT